jgi:hypothetical protein
MDGDNTFLVNFVTSYKATCITAMRNSELTSLWRRMFREKFIVPQPIKTSHAFVKPKKALSCSQNPTTIEPVRSRNPVPASSPKLFYVPLKYPVYTSVTQPASSVNFSRPKLCTHLASLMCSTRPARLLLVLIILVIGAEHNLRNCAVRICFHPFTCCHLLLETDIILSFFSGVLTVCSRLVTKGVTFLSKFQNFYPKRVLRKANKFEHFRNMTETPAIWQNVRFLVGGS